MNVYYSSCDGRGLKSTFSLVPRPSHPVEHGSLFDPHFLETMNRIQGVLAIVAIFVVVVDGRVYYLQNSDGNRYAGQTYPVPNEQSSRDLDLSFSAGDPNEIDDSVQPANKVYTLVAPPAKPFVEVNKEELPNVRYKLVEAPIKRFAGPDDVIILPEQTRKTVKIDGNNKGEVILELRVIANHDSA